MRGLRYVAAAMALMCAAGCGAANLDSEAVVPRTPPPTLDAEGPGTLPDAGWLVLASSEGVDLMTESGDLTRLSHRPAAIAYGIRNNLIAFQGSDGAGDVYPPSPVGSIELWSDGALRDLPVDPGASSVLLLDAGLINSRPVVLVAERFSEGQPERATEALVLIDLEDFARLTVVPRQPAWESGYQAAHLRPDGDIVGLYEHGVRVDLVRWSSKEGNRSWSVKVAEDRVVNLAASDTSVAVVELSFDERRGFAPILTITRHDLATGEPLDTTVVDVADPEGVIDTGVFCRAWLTASVLACARSGRAPIALSLDGSFDELGGPPGAMPSVVQDP